MANNAAVTTAAIVGLTWSAVAYDGGSPVIDYKISYKPVGGTYSVLTTVTFPTTSYTASSLTAGTIYTFKVSARNLFGLGADSSEVNVMAASVPAAPLALANSAAVTASSIVGFTWSAPASNGGSAITNYQVSYKLVGGTYSVLGSVTFPTTSFTASSLTADAIYTFKVTAQNTIGYGPDSSEVNIRAAATPSVPAAPTTSVNSNVSVTITWVAPYDGGSPITGYTVAIRQNDGTTFTVESANCNVSTTSCTAPISVFLAAPYTLAWGASIYATVKAKNLVGSSVASPSGNGAVITTNPDPPSTLANNAVITSSTVIGLTWVAPTMFGGTTVIDY